MEVKVDICVVGAGSGGVTAAYNSAKYAPNKKVLLIENQSVIGGTSTIGGVNAWEPGCVGNSKLHYTFFDKLYKNNNAVIAKYFSVSPKPRVCAWVAEDKTATYEQTFKRKDSRRVIFNPIEMIKVMENSLGELENLDVMCNCVLMDAKTSSNRITSITAYDSFANEVITIKADMFIDSSGEIVLARMAGCKTERSEVLNGVSQMFVVEKKDFRQVEDVPNWVDKWGGCEWIRDKDPDVIFNQYPNGKLNVNTLPTIDGDEFISMGSNAKKIAVARTYALWNVLQKEKGFDNYRLSYIFPMLGIREGYRLVGKYILTEDDILCGQNKQKHKDSLIAISDHAIDKHKSDDNSLRELDDCYGVPYECTLANEIENLSVACRGMSLTSVAAASCRLQRTIMQVGEMVGIAAAFSISNSFHDVDCNKIIKIMEA